MTNREGRKALVNTWHPARGGTLCSLSKDQKTVRDKSAEPYEMEKSREGSGSKNIQIKKGEVFQVERHQTGKIATGTRESLDESKLGEDLGSKLPGSTSSR